MVNRALSKEAVELIGRRLIRVVDVERAPERLELLLDVRISATAGVRVCYPNPIALALILTLTLILALS